MTTDMTTPPGLLAGPPVRHSKAEAKALGLSTFHVVAPCPKDHTTERTLRGGHCVACAARERAKLDEAYKRGFEAGKAAALKGARALVLREQASEARRVQREAEWQAKQDAKEAAKEAKAKAKRAEVRARNKAQREAEAAEAAQAAGDSLKGPAVTPPDALPALLAELDAKHRQEEAEWQALTSDDNAPPWL